MKFGIGFFSLQRPADQTRSFAELYKDFLAEAELADACGLDSIWLCEHHFFEDGFVNALLPVCAAALARTRRIRLGADILYSLYHPLRCAEDSIALDLLSEGRFLLGLAATYLDFELAAFGLSKDGETERLGEFVAILRAAMASQPFSFNGNHYKVPQIKVTPPPFTSGGPPLVLGSHGNPEHEIQRAVREGSHYRTNPVWPMQDVIRAATSFLSQQPDLTREVFVYNYGFISERQDPWEIMEPGYRHIRQTYDKVAGREIPAHIAVASAAVKASRADRLKRDDFRLILGNRAQVKQQIEQYATAVGERMHFVLRLSYPGVEPQLTREAIELYADVARGFR